MPPLKLPWRLPLLPWSRSAPSSSPTRQRAAGGGRRRRRRLLSLLLLLGLRRRQPRLRGRIRRSRRRCGAASASYFKESGRWPRRGGSAGDGHGGDGGVPSRVDDGPGSGLGAARHQVRGEPPRASRDLLRRRLPESARRGPSAVESDVSLIRSIVQCQVPVVERAREPEDPRGGRGVRRASPRLRLAAGVDSSPVEAARHFVDSVNSALCLRGQGSQESVDAGDEERGAGARGVGIAGEDREVEILEGGKRRRGAAPAPVRFVFFFVFLFFVEIFVVVVVRHAIDVVNKVLIDVLIVVVVVGVLLEREKNEFFLRAREKGEREKGERARQKIKRPLSLCRFFHSHLFPLEPQVDLPLDLGVCCFGCCCCCCC